MTRPPAAQKRRVTSRKWSRRAPGTRSKVMNVPSPIAGNTSSPLGILRTIRSSVATPFCPVVGAAWATFTEPATTLAPVAWIRVRRSIKLDILASLMFESRFLNLDAAEHPGWLSSSRLGGIRPAISPKGCAWNERD
jgi:hypothetical protein